MDEKLLSLIGLIYDAIVQPEVWDTVLETIRVRHGWHNASFNILALPQQKVLLQVARNIPDDVLRLPNIVQDIVAMWGGESRFAQLPLEEPILQSHQSDPSTWHRYSLARDWSWPQGLVDQLGIFLVRDRTTSAAIAFAQHKSMHEISSTVMDELRLLAPHLRRAATISRVLERTMTRAATFEAALDSASNGAVLVRDDLAIVYSNAAADAMLRNSDPISTTGGRLQLAEELAPGHLEHAVRAAADGPVALGRRGLGIPTRRKDGSPVVAHVMPLVGRGNVAIEAAAAVFVADTAGAEPVLSDKLSLLFEMTPAETRIFEMAAAGESPARMARRLGVAPSTVRTHLQRVYEKTGRHRQVELVALGRELKLPL